VLRNSNADVNSTDVRPEMLFEQKPKIHLEFELLVILYHLRLLILFKLLFP
jgi:hypothetical protein